MEMQHKKLFEKFPPVTTQEWIDKIKADLKGDDFNTRLVWKTAEGFDVMPFYRKEDIQNLNHIDALIPLLLRGDINSESHDVIEKPHGKKILPESWRVRQNIRVNNYETANKKALDILMMGVDSLGFMIDDAETINQQNISVLLNDIDHGGTEINFQSNGKAKEIISFLISHCERQGINTASVEGAVEADPVGRLMKFGTLCIPVSDGFDYLASLTRDCYNLPRFRNIQVNGLNITNEKTESFKELAFALSMAVEYLDQLTERGISADMAASKMRFSFRIGPDYFMEIAKLRASRILWSLISDSYGKAYDKSFRMEINSYALKDENSTTDPYKNMLRTQTEAMSAILGGTDSLNIELYDNSGILSEEFSERMARNQQLILKEEAWFGKVTDPSAGSYYLETLTALIAKKAWELFIETENEGGFLCALERGFIREKLSFTKDESIKTDL
jgi:methylmalonyl-CoA mutase